MGDMNLLTSVNENISKISLNMPADPPSYLGFEFLEHGEEMEPHKIQNGCGMPLAVSPVYMSRVISARMLSSGSDVKQIIEMNLEINEESVNWHPGDTIGIIPQNQAEEVRHLLQLLGVAEKAHCLVKIFVKSDTQKKNAFLPPYLPPVSTLENIFLTCLAIRDIPKKALLKVLSSYTSVAEERLRLEQLCSRQGASDYSTYIVEKGATLITLLKAFPSCKPPITRLLELLPRLSPRPYSIACSEAPLRVVFSVLPGGLCTNWLSTQLYSIYSMEGGMANMKLEGSTGSIVQVPVYFRKSSSFRMPEFHEKPLILIATGTGIAPFIGFLQKREIEERKSCSYMLGTIWLFFGCRYASKDFIYRWLLKGWLDTQTLSRLFLSFSREGDKEESPKYVQDNIKLNGKEFVTKLLDEGGSVFVCGDKKHMAKDVQEAILFVIQTEKDISEEEAQNCVAELKASERYVQDVWR